MAATVFDAQIQAVDRASGPIRAMVQGMREIIVAARGVASSSEHGARAAGHAGKAAAHAVKHAAEGVSKAGQTATKAIEQTEHAVEHAERSHIRFFRAIGGHVRLLRGHFGELHASIGEIGSSLTEFLPMLGALGAGGSLVGLFEMTKEAGEAAIALDAAAQKIGVTAGQFAGLSWAAKENAVSTETMTSSLEKLNKTVGGAVAGKAKDAAALFHHLGIQMKDAQGHTRSTADLLPQLADAFAKTRDPAMRALMATTLFGKAGQELLPMLMKGREALAEMSEAGEKFADLGTDEEREKLKAFGHSWGELGASMDGFKTRLATELAPVLLPIVEMARDWVMANRDWIATAIADKVRLLAEAIKGIHLKELLTDVWHYAQMLHHLTAGHGELLAIVGAVTLAMGSPLYTVVTRIGGAFMMLGRIVTGLGALSFANPWLLAAYALIAVAVLVYEKWDWVKGVMVAFTQLPWGQVLADSFKPFLLVPELIVQAFEWAWQKLQPIIERLKGAADWARTSWLGRGLGAVADVGGRVANSVGNALATPFANPEFGAPPIAPNLYRPDGPAAQALQQKGEVNVKVDFTNTPPGTQVRTDASGIAQPPDTSIGFLNPLAFGY
ncbi:phage tail tape measure protein [Rhodopila sp.]|uniref:phage tail tape measure protein n=1 Tax=Rhodopila sp. TaxID=2480087 RepID=UPI003D0D01F0